MSTPQLARGTLCKAQVFFLFLRLICCSGPGAPKDPSWFRCILSAVVPVVQHCLAFPFAWSLDFPLVNLKPMHSSHPLAQMAMCFTRFLGQTSSHSLFSFPVYSSRFADLEENVPNPFFATSTPLPGSQLPVLHHASQPFVVISEGGCPTA